MSNPCQRHLTVLELRKARFPILARSPYQKSLPNHLMKKSARIEVIARRKFLKGTRDSAPLSARMVRQWVRHSIGLE